MAFPMMENVRINGLCGRDSAPHVLSVSFAGCAARCFCMRWRNGKSMCPQEARAHRTIRIRQERDASGDRSAEGAVEFDDPFQPFRLYDRGRN